MGRLSKEKKAAIDIELDKHKDIFSILGSCGGALYVDDLSSILERPVSTLRYHIKNSIALGLLNKDKIPVGSTKRDVIRLTRLAWGKLNVNRGMVSIQERTIERCLINAILNKYLNFEDKKNHFLSDLKIDDLKYSLFDEDTFHRKSIYSNLPSIKDNDKFLVEEYKLDIKNKNVYLKCYYIIKDLDKYNLRELSDVIDILVGIFEWYSSRNDCNFYYNKNYIKIDLSVVSEIDLNIDKAMKSIKKYKRYYYIFSKQKVNRADKVELYYSINFIFENHINFLKINKSNCCLDLM